MRGCNKEIQRMEELSKRKKLQRTLKLVHLRVPDSAIERMKKTGTGGYGCRRKRSIVLPDEDWKSGVLPDEEARKQT